VALLDDLLPETRPGLSQLPDVSLVAALRRGAQRFLRESQVWADDLEAFALVVGRHTYPLPLPDGARVERILTVKVNGREIDVQMRPRELRALADTDGPPTAWAIFDSQDEQVIAFDRTPRAAEAGFSVAIHASLAITNEAAELPDWIVNDWHDGIVAGARMELLGQRGTPHYDPDAAARERFNFSMDVARAKRVQVSGRHALLRAQPRPWV
jgi:hypothetical protein